MVRLEIKKKDTLLSVPVECHRGREWYHKYRIVVQVPCIDLRESKLDL